MHAIVSFRFFVIVARHDARSSTAHWSHNVYLLHAWSFDMVILTLLMVVMVLLLLLLLLVMVMMMVVMVQVRGVQLRIVVGIG